MSRRLGFALGDACTDNNRGISGVRWDVNGVGTDLGRPNGARKAEAVSINNGVIVGYTGDNFSPLTAVKWD